MGYDFDGPNDDEFLPYNPFSPRARKLGYGCINCRQIIEFGNVLYMSQIADDAFTLFYTCDCTHHKTSLETRFQVVKQALHHLLGPIRPHLPYRAAPGPYLGLSEEHEKLLKVAAFDLDGVECVEDLLLYLDGPGSARQHSDPRG